ncbi:MAG TPA: hypothetical protein VFO28_18345 [Burkholderiaceae bacterium]|nr:hypothetical protein [Burkholderiaceae bacterium]
MNSSAAHDSRIQRTGQQSRPVFGAASSCALVSLAFVGAYGLANRLTSLRADVGRGVFEWERVIPFVEWTIVPYLSIAFFFIASFFVCRDRAELERHVARVLLLLTISIACYAAFPLRFQFVRPETSGAIGALFQLLTAIDLPYNRAPSLHIGMLTLLWVGFAPRLVGGWRLALHVWFAAIGVSVLTTYQHHVIDIPAGVAVASFSLAATARGRFARMQRQGSARHPAAMRLIRS